MDFGDSSGAVQPPLDSWRWAHIVAPAIHPCWDCGKATRFVQVDFEAPLHPGACTDRKWDEYDQALAAAPTPPPQAGDPF